jgi:hypothetical protein
MATAKTVALNLRVTPEKKAALMALAERQRLDVTKLVLPQIDRLLEEGKADLPKPIEMEPKGPDDEITLTGKISFWPLPGDEKHVKQYAAVRDITPSTVIRLILRSWISKNPPLPRNELAQLAITSNQLAALGRNLNQLVKLAHAGEGPLPEDLMALLQDTLKLTRQTSLDMDAVVKTNLTSWESDHA